jgi:ubiquinone/menaquinone biosynthesis C-methylase UbiE
MENYQYQYNFSDQHTVLFNYSERQQKANKIIAVLKDFLKDDFKDLKLIDIGSSTGIMTKLLSEHFSETVGIDIDEQGVKYARENFENDHLSFSTSDAMNINFPDNSFDVVNCSHIYEHVPDSKKLMSEIYRVLKPGGVCFLAAGNRFVFMEAHYNLPLLSVIPKWMAHKYIKIFKKADFYYETHLTYWGLKKLVSKFEVDDYTIRIIKNPTKFYATEMVKENSLAQFLYLKILKMAYWLSPDFIWILQKKVSR